MNDTLIITHGLKKMPFHFLTDKGLLQLSHFGNKRTRPTKLLNKIVNGTTRGYMINRKFVSLTYLESIRFPITKVLFYEEPNECPF